jgi:hypothetical protein
MIENLKKKYMTQSKSLNFDQYQFDLKESYTFQKKGHVAEAKSASNVIYHNSQNN